MRNAANSTGTSNADPSKATASRPSPLVYIYADESCLGNGRTGATPGAAAGAVAVWKDGDWVRRDYWVSEADTTNNRMAIRSATEALRALKVPCSVIFVSDSQYLVKGMSEWMAGWVRRGWRKAGQGGKPGDPVENAELWKELLGVAARHKIEWRWVRGHAGSVMNEFANWLAIRAAKEQGNSGGLVSSAFDVWLRQEKEKGRYVSIEPDSPPPTEQFKPTPVPQPK
jgi:ribonuclease HI